MGHSVACYVHSLPPLTLLTHYAALRLTRFARSVHGLAHSLRSLPRGTVENLEYVFTLLSRFTGTNALFVFTRNTPFLSKKRFPLSLSISGQRPQRRCTTQWEFVCLFVCPSIYPFIHLNVPDLDFDPHDPYYFFQGPYPARVPNSNHQDQY